MSFYWHMRRTLALRCNDGKGNLIPGEYLSVPASVGFIALLGIAVLNGVVMVSYFNQLRAFGMEMAKVVVLGSLRLRGTDSKETPVTTQFMNVALSSPPTYTTPPLPLHQLRLTVQLIIVTAPSLL